MTLGAGSRLGSYEINDVLGEGGMGQVYRATDTRLGRQVAIKVLPPGRPVTPQQRDRFEREARAIARLNHPGICSLYDIGHDSGVDFLVMEFVAGETLATKIRDAAPRGGFTPTEAIDYVLQVARALDVAHREGVVHRDIKPGNLMVTASGQIKVLDFGLAKVAEPASGDEATRTREAPRTAAGIVMGTPEYMSPEQALGRDVDARSDLFSLGVVLYELLTGRRPFTRTAVGEVVDAVIREAPAPFESQLRLPPDLKAIVAKLLDKDRARRHQSAGALIADLERARAQFHTGSRPARRISGRALLVSAVAIVGVLAWIYRPRNDAAVTHASGEGSSARTSPFLDSPALEAEPCWSPAGNLIAYTSDAAGNNDIWVVDANGANAINLTAASKADDWGPEWSPDGQMIAFYSVRDGSTAIYTMTALGGGVRRIVDLGLRFQREPVFEWAKDGSFLFAASDGNNNIYRLKPGSTTRECLTCGLNISGFVDWAQGRVSPSGRWLAFKAALGGTQGRIYIRELAGGSVEEIAQRADHPRWAEDDSALYYISDRDGVRDVWKAHIDPSTGKRRGDPVRLTSSLNATWLTMSPSGNELLVARDMTTNRLWEISAHDRSAEFPASAVPRTTAGAIDTWPHWLPGDGLLFASDRRGSTDVWRISNRNASPEQLTMEVASETRPAYSPDGAWLVFDKTLPSGNYTHVATRDGSQPRIGGSGWPAEYGLVCCVDFSSSGTQLTLVLSGKRFTGVGIAQFDRTTGSIGPLRELPLGDGSPEYGRWSPDDRRLIYDRLAQDLNIWTALADGSGARRRFGG